MKEVIKFPNRIVVRTQKELDKHLQSLSEPTTFLLFDDFFEISPKDYVSFEAHSGSLVKVYGNCPIRAYSGSIVELWGCLDAVAYHYSTVLTYEGSSITAYGYSRVVVMDASKVTARGSSLVVIPSESSSTSDVSEITAFEVSIVCCDLSKCRINLHDFSRCIMPTGVNADVQLTHSTARIFIKNDSQDGELSCY